MYIPWIWGSIHSASEAIDMLWLKHYPHSAKLMGFEIWFDKRFLVCFLPHSEMIRFLLREKNVTTQEILSEISLFVKNPLLLRAMFLCPPGPFLCSYNFSLTVLITLLGDKSTQRCCLWTHKDYHGLKVFRVLTRILNLPILL